MTGPRVVRIQGDVVHRPAAPWTPTVQALLAHLHAAGLPVPEPLGYDERTEHVRALPGDAGQDAWPHQLDPAGVRSAGALLRAVHEATRSWTPPADARWSVPADPAGTDPGGTVCHGDPQPANLTWRGGRAVGLFDWDAARPAAPLSDVAYALLWFAPFNADEDETVRRGLSRTPDRRRRAAALLEGYGWTAPLDVAEVALARHEQAIAEVEGAASRGHQPEVDWVTAGWPARWRAELPRLRALAAS